MHSSLDYSLLLEVAGRMLLNMSEGDFLQSVKSEEKLLGRWLKYK